MKLLYGVQGTGNGHIARARIMAAALSQCSDIDVDFVFTALLAPFLGSATTRCREGGLPWRCYWR